MDIVDNFIVKGRLKLGFRRPFVFAYLNPIFFATHTAPAMPVHHGMSKATGA